RAVMSACRLPQSPAGLDVGVRAGAGAGEALGDNGLGVGGGGTSGLLGAAGALGASTASGRTTMLLASFRFGQAAFAAAPTADLTAPDVAVPISVTASPLILNLK